MMALLRKHTGRRTRRPAGLAELKQVRMDEVIAARTIIYQYEGLNPKDERAVRPTWAQVAIMANSLSNAARVIDAELRRRERR